MHDNTTRLPAQPTRPRLNCVFKSWHPITVHAAICPLLDLGRLTNPPLPSRPTHALEDKTYGGLTPHKPGDVGDAP